MPSAIEITPQEYRNPPVAGEIEPSNAGFSEFRVPERKYELRSGKYEVRVSGFAEVVNYPNLLLRQAYMVIPRLLPPHSRGLVCLVCYSRRSALPRCTPGYWLAPAPRVLC